MNKYYYDLHVHSCLSPCGDDDNTPHNIAAMASLCGLNIVALTDHNTCKNCPSFFKAAKKYGIIPIAGMELTSSEDIHVVCLFEDLESALSFDSYIEENRVLIKNKPAIFGEQTVLDENDEVISTEEYLLTNASNVSVEEINELIKNYNGVCFPAHIDRESNGIISILGTIPPNNDFRFFELNKTENLHLYSEKYGIDRSRFLISSDAHCLTDMRDKENFFELDDEPYSSDHVRRQLFCLLRGNV